MFEIICNIDLEDDDAYCVIKRDGAVIGGRSCKPCKFSLERELADALGLEPSDENLDRIEAVLDASLDPVDGVYRFASL